MNAPDRICGRRRRKLTDNDVSIIRRQVAEGERLADVAAQFNVSKSYVSRLTRDWHWDRFARAAHDVFDTLERLGAQDDYWTLAEALGDEDLAERIYAFVEFERTVHRARAEARAAETAGDLDHELLEFDAV